MMRVLAAFFAVALAAGCALAQTTTEFDANVRIYNDPAITGAIGGTIKYRESIEHIRYTYDVTSQGPIEIFDFGEEIRYLYCTACEAETRGGNMFMFRQENTDTQQGAVGATTISAWQSSGANNGVPVQVATTRFTKQNAQASGGVTDVYIDASNRIVRAVFENGKTVDFWGHSAASGDVRVQTAWNCPEKQCNLQLDIFFVVDESGSISDNEWYDSMRPFLRDFSKSFDMGSDKVQLGATFFAGSNTLRQPITDSNATWFGWLNNYPCANKPGNSRCAYGSGGTYAEYGIEQAVKYLIEGKDGNNKIRASAEKLIVLVTDGAMSCPSCARNAATTAKNPPKNILIFCVGVDGANVAQMNDMASGSGGLLNGQKTVFFANNFADLPGIIEGLSTTVCTEIPGNPCGSQCGGFCSCNKQCLCPSDCGDGNLCTTDLGCPTQLPNRCEWTPKNVDDGNACTNDVCNTATGAITNTYPGTCDSFSFSCGVGVCNPLDGSCSTFANSTCDDGNACTTDTCSGTPGQTQGTCTNTQVQNCQACTSVPPDESCKTTRCDLTNGQLTPLTGNSSCADVEIIANNVLFKWTPCTPGVCDATRTVGSPARACTNPSECCEFPPLNCDTDQNPCTIDTCDPTSTTPDAQSGNPIGTCVQTPNLCDDDNECTADSCDPTQGCIHTLRNDACPPASGPCFQQTCVNECRKDPFNPTAPCVWNITCAESGVNCIAQLQAQINDCYFGSCNNNPGGGCQVELRKGAEIDDCGQCNPAGEEPQVCIPPIETEEAVAIGAGVLAAIIIGAIAFVLLAGVGGAGAYKVYSAYRGNMSGAQSNPLFQDRGMEGENALFEEEA